MQDLESNPISMLRSLIDQYHADPDSFTEDQAERIAMLAFDANINFEPETKKAKKLAFDVADMALFGLLPNEWRPKRVGEDLYGESAGEKISGALGTLLGLATGVTGAYKLGKAGLTKSKSAMSDAVAGFKSVGKQRARRMNPFDLTGIGNVGVPL